MGMAGASTAVEQVVAGLARRDGTAGRTDVDATFDGARGNAPLTLRCDVAVVHPTAASYVRAASTRAGATATAREARKTTRYAVACQPDKFYGTIVETGGRISAGFIALLLTLATQYTSAAAGFDTIPASLQQVAVAEQLARYYAYISVGSRQAVSITLARAAARICSLHDVTAQPSHRRRRFAFRSRPLGHAQLLTRILPCSTGSHVH